MFGDIQPLIASEEFSGANLHKLQEILSDKPTARKLKVEMAVTVNGMEPFVTATYFFWKGMDPLHCTVTDRSVYSFQ